MNRLRRIVSTLTCLLALPAMAAETGAGDATTGRKHYQDFGCWQCHGTTGAGGGWQGPKLAPDPLPYVAFAAQIRKPRRRCRGTRRTS